MYGGRDGLLEARHTEPSHLIWSHLNGGRAGSTETRPGGAGRRPLLFGVLFVIGLAFAASACGGSSPRASVASVATTTSAVPTTPSSGGQSSGSEASGSEASGSQSSGSLSSGGALVEYARCMRSHGVVSFPEPASLGAAGAIRAFKGQVAASVAALASSPEFQHAQRACAKYYGPATTSAPHVTPQEMRKLLAVSRCMRAHGVPNFPDPNPTTGEMSTPAGLSRDSTTVVAALRACSPLARAAGLGPPNTGQ
jgi:hypothetical protein